MNARDWQDGNSRYLGISLQWLRLRLEALAPIATPAPTTSEPPLQPVEDSHTVATSPIKGAEQGAWLQRIFGSPTHADAQTVRANGRVPQLPGARAVSRDEQIETLEAEREQLANTLQPAPGLVILGHQLGLTQFELDTLLLCVAMELDTRMAALCARAQDDVSRSCPTFALALALFQNASWDALSADAPLRYWRLIEINQPGATPLTSSPLRADERIVNYVKGLNHLDDRLSNLFTRVRPRHISDQADQADENTLPPSQDCIVDRLLKRLRQMPSSEAFPIVQLLGADSASKQIVAGALTTAVGRTLYRATIEALPTQMMELDMLARLWMRENQLLPLALYLDGDDGDQHDAAKQAGLHRFLTRIGDADGLVLLGLREALPRLTEATVIVDVGRPTPTEQRAAWKASLLRAGHAEGDATQAADQLAGQFNLNLPDLYGAAHAATDATTLSTNANASVSEQLWDVCLDAARPRLDTLAQRLDVKATWDDLVVPEEQSHLLRLISEQVRQRSRVYGDWGFGRKMNRGMGIGALFAGESGTGKTMAAEVIASALRLHLYRIDLSQVVSKYIGETEKNLRRLFDAAEMGGAILFFDEADALFGKRSEVKDSHDRYANIEINYLLQRMEAFSGLAILATNLKSSLDTAFMRRLRFIVNFPLPGLAERRLIWQKAFPTELPTEHLDYERLARFNLTGGNIHSIALNAAFLAAHDGSPVNMPVVLAAVRMELRKLDRPVNEGEFRGIGMKE